MADPQQRARKKGLSRKDLFKKEVEQTEEEEDVMGVDEEQNGHVRDMIRYESGIHSRGRKR